MKTLEGKRTMPYVTHIERLAMAEGIEKGREDGLLEAIALGLKLRFGPAGLALLPRVRKLHDLKRLRACLALVHRAETIAALRARLPRG